MANKLYIVFYQSPEKVKGAYKVSAEDSIKAGNIVHKKLKAVYGDFRDSHSIIMEVPHGIIFNIQG